MPEPTTKRSKRSRLWIWAGAGVCAVAVVVGLAWYLRSPQFADLVRRKVMATVEDATGGRVELGEFHWDLSRLQFVAHDLTVHGLENGEESPYLHVDQVNLRLRIVSFVQRRVSLDYLGLEHPVIHVIVNPDGTTNAPEPRQKQSTTEAVQQLFDLEAARAELHNGVLLLNDRAVPLDFGANDVAAAMVYVHADRRYDGTFRVGKIDLKYADLRDVAAQARIDFSLLPGALQIKSLDVQSEKSHLLAKGLLKDFENPKVDFSYESSLDAAQLGAVMRVYRLRGGTASVNGSGSYSAGGYASRGTLLVRGLDYLDDGLSLRNANADADFSLDNEKLSLKRIAARLLGGEVAGEAEVKDWLASASNGPAQAKVAPSDRKTPQDSRTSHQPVTVVQGRQRGTAHLRVSRLALNEVARMLSSRSLPLDQLKPAGTVTGTVDLKWQDALSAADADLALAVEPPAQALDGELPVTATLHGSYSVRRSMMNIAALDLTTPHTHLNAAGAMGSTSANVKLDLKTDSLTEFQPLLTAMGASSLPVELAGEAEFNGTLQGRIRQPEIAGHLQATNFTYLYTPVPVGPPAPAVQPAKAKTWLHAGQPQPVTQQPPLPQPRRIHVDQFSGDLKYGPTELTLHDAVVRQGDARISVDGTVTLDNGKVSDNSSFQVKAAVHDADLAGLQAAVGTGYPLSGKLNLDFQGAGTVSNPHGQGHISVNAGQAYGRPVQALTSDILFSNHQAQLQNIHLQAAHGTVQGSAAYNLSTKAIAFDLSGQSIDLADVPEVQTERLKTAGSVSFSAKGSGSTAEPVINAHLDISGLVMNGEAVGGLAADAVTHGRQLQLTARSHFPKASLSLDGTIELRGDMPADIRMQFSKLDVDPFLRTEVQGHITGHSAMAGQASLNGPLRQPQLLRGDFRIASFGVEVEHVPIASEGPIELTLGNGLVTVKQLSLVSEDSRLTLTGSFGVKDDRRLDLHSNGHVDLKVAHIIDPDISSYGMVDLDVRIDGSMGDPLVQGRVDIVHGGLSMIDVPSGLGDINGSLVFNKDRLQVEHLTAHTGGGLVSFDGFITYGRAVSFNLAASGTDIRFRYAGISVTSDQKLRLQGTMQNAVLSGDITVTRFAQIPSTDLRFTVAQTGPSRTPNPKSPLNNLHLDVRILSSPDLTVQTSLAKLAGDVDLRLRGTAARPVLLGRINVAEGDINLSGTKYHLDRGDITFTDPVRIDPVLDIQATTRVRDYDITIGLHGTIEKLNTTYRSDPPLSSEDIVALLAFGRTEQERATGGAPSSGFAETASGAMINQAINQTVTNRVGKLFGVSSIRINPSVGGPENNANARLTIEQQVSSNVTFTYITNLAQSAQQVIQFEYNINSEYTFQGIRDENGVVSLDLLIRKRKR